VGRQERPNLRLRPGGTLPAAAGGPMVSAEEWKASFSERRERVPDLDVRGAKREVLMMAAEIPESHAWVNLHSEDLFKRGVSLPVLTSASLVDQGQGRQGQHDLQEAGE